MIKKINEDDFVRNFLRKAHKLKEDINNTQNSDEIVIDKNDEKFQEFSNNITKFVGALRVDDKAQIVYPNDSDVVFNGIITDLNNLKFQFRYNDQSGGLYIWADSLLLTKEVSDKIAKLVTIRGQWKDYWSASISQYTEQNKPE